MPGALRVYVSIFLFTQGFCPTRICWPWCGVREHVPGPLWWQSGPWRGRWDTPWEAWGQEVYSGCLRGPAHSWEVTKLSLPKSSLSPRMQSQRCLWGLISRIAAQRPKERLQILIPFRETGAPLGAANAMANRNTACRSPPCFHLENTWEILHDQSHHKEVKNSQ